MIETTSLELSKKLFATLTEAGVVPDAYLVWVKSLCSGIEKRVKRGTCSTADWCYIAPAFTACELDKLLPNEIDDGTGNFFIYRSGKFWGYRDPDGRFLVELQGTKPLAEKMGDLLLLLYENGHMEKGE